MKTMLEVQTRGRRDVFSPEAAFVQDRVERQVAFKGLADIPLEACSPVRSFSAWPGKRNYSGLYWSSTTCGHVPFESLYERTALMVLDRDPSVVGIASQPVCIFWPKGHVPRSHAPDFFVRHADASGELIDVRPASRIDPDSAATFEATRQLCESVGLRFRVMSEMTEEMNLNLRFLARYRHAIWQLPEDRLGVLSRIAGQAGSLEDLAAELSQGGSRVQALGWVFTLIWSGAIEADLEKKLGLHSTVRVQSEVAR